MRYNNNRSNRSYQPQQIFRYTNIETTGTLTVSGMHGGIECRNCNIKAKGGVDASGGGIIFSGDLISRGDVIGTGLDAATYGVVFLNGTKAQIKGILRGSCSGNDWYSTHGERNIAINGDINDIHARGFSSQYQGGNCLGSCLRTYPGNNSYTPDWCK